MKLSDILKKAKDAGASDILITTASPPVLRIHSKLTPLKEFAPLTADTSRDLIFSMMTEGTRQKLKENLEADFSVSVKDLGRYRVSVYTQRGSLAAAIRPIVSTIPDMDTLGFPPAMKQLAKLHKGLVLLTGPTGSGKSTSLASIINLINAERACHIITLEDPIEFLFRNKSSIIDQREVHSDTHSFTAALRSALRQDPDVVLLGEMRDYETVSIALTTAETGHLVLSSLHTQDAAQTIDRILDVFPSDQQSQIRNQLSMTLKAIICQQLIPRKDGRGLIAAREILIVTPAIANLIRENKIFQINTVIQTSAKEGMISMENALINLYKEGLISDADAVAKANEPSIVRKALGQTGQK